MPLQIEHVCQSLAAVAPLRLAESWDNVGLLIGDRRRDCRRVMTCLTITPDVVAEATDQQVDLIVAHHPLPFKPIARLTTDSTASGMVLELAAHRIAVYSAHTAFDSARRGINQQLAEGLQLTDIAPLQTDPADTSETPDGSGRYGRVAATTLEQIMRRAADFLKLPNVRYVGDPDAAVTKVALACGSGGSFLDAARRKGCDCMLTGESNFHGCLEAQSQGIGLILVGHYASERFAMEQLADHLIQEHDELTVWASRSESDPLRQFSL
ncbi:Putative GTP cyclohydrolase 1 type 2 [Rosistilla carotiformis]|uniref:GTP cyclohydrolase 1 type 2 homolog n=1 Tax=Rosistilla carotiformis TaxID=2528017 RepID=A0A518K052_9BACT|nr:Nif3-like dinuclear metal center hexameric protein [Rosistilla carotiformis]QDV71177.1 Putative GTP cyclohydrolase 1 type 2 [Rosistilla carotiformis]